MCFPQRSIELRIWEHLHISGIERWKGGRINEESKNQNGTIIACSVKAAGRAEEKEPSIRKRKNPSWMVSIIGEFKLK